MADEKRVICFGTFDGLHEGHRFFLNTAAGHGRLRVIVAIDDTVRRLKGRDPVRGQDKRLAAVRAEGYDAVLGIPDDTYDVVTDWEADLICLGHDQDAFAAHLQAWIDRAGYAARIIRLPSYRPEVYRSSLLDAEKRKG